MTLSYGGEYVVYVYFIVESIEAFIPWYMPKCIVVNLLCSVNTLPAYVVFVFPLYSELQYYYCLLKYNSGDDGFELSTIRFSCRKHK